MSEPQSTEVKGTGSWPTTVVTVTNYSSKESLSVVILTLGSPELGNPAVINLGDILPSSTAEFDAAFHANAILVQWTSKGVQLSAPPQTAKTGYYFEKIGFSIEPDGSIVKVSPDLQHRLP